MIADTAYMSSSPVILIDEIENAGIDRRQAISILTRKDKIVFMSTHDPLLALSASKRIVIRNGGIAKIIETTEEERASQTIIEELDGTIMRIREMLRHGERITPDRLDGFSRWRCAIRRAASRKGAVRKLLGGKVRYRQRGAVNGKKRL